MKISEFHKKSINISVRARRWNWGAMGNLVSLSIVLRSESAIWYLFKVHENMKTFWWQIEPVYWRWYLALLIVLVQYNLQDYLVHTCLKHNYVQRTKRTWKVFFWRFELSKCYKNLISKKNEMKCKAHGVLLFIPFLFFYSYEPLVMQKLFQTIKY